MSTHQILTRMQAITFCKKEHHVVALLIFGMKSSWKLATHIGMPWLKGVVSMTQQLLGLLRINMRYVVRSSVEPKQLLIIN